MADKTTQKDGNWSDTAVWNGGTLPTSGQTIQISHNVIYDVDTSGFAAGHGAISIDAGKSITASTTAGAYYMKMAGSITGNGSLVAGTSALVTYPSSCTFTIQQTSTTGNIQTAGGTNLYCVEPAIKYVKLSQGAIPGDTVLNVDTSVLSDIWAAGNLINIDDVTGTLPDSETRTIAAGGISAGTITVTAGLTAAKSAGSYVFLVSRNIKIIGPNSGIGNYGVSPYNDTNIYAEIRLFGRGVSGGLSPRNVTIGGTITNCLSRGLFYCSSSVHVGVISNTVVGWEVPQGYSRFNIISGCTQGINGGSGGKIYGINGIVSGCGTGISGGQYPGVELSGCVIDSCTTGVTNAEITASGCTFSNVTRDLQFTTGRLYNCTIGASTENQYYNSSVMTQADILESFDHDAVEGAFRAWTRGGVTSSTATSPPTGRPRSYQTVCESATYPGWYQREIVVDAGRQLRFRVWLKADAGVEIKAQLVLPTADPLVTGTGTGEWQQIGTSDGTWHEYVTSWTNSATYPVTVYARVLSTAESGNGYSDMMWAFDRTPLVR
jgi:hypothetical protein